MRIRPVDEDDVTTLVILAEKFMPKMASARKRADVLKQALKDPNYELLVAELDKEIIGFIDRWDISDFAHGTKLSYIENLYVLPQFRRKGAGDTLLEKIVESARRKGAHEIYIATGLEYKPAISLYKKHGFVKRGLQLEMEL